MKTLSFKKNKYIIFHVNMSYASAQKKKKKKWCNEKFATLFGL